MYVKESPMQPYELREETVKVKMCSRMCDVAKLETDYKGCPEFLGVVGNCS